MLTSDRFHEVCVEAPGQLPGLCMPKNRAMEPEFSIRVHWSVGIDGCGPSCRGHSKQTV